MELLINLGKPKPEYIKSLDNILFSFGLSKLGNTGNTFYQAKAGHL